MKPVFKNYFKLSTMKEERLDNIFRQELGQHDSGTPDHLWAGIEARRKKPNRAIAWWATGLVAIFVVGLSGWYLLNPDSISNQKELTVETHAPITDANSTLEKENLSTDKTQQTLANETDEEIQTVSTTTSIAVQEKSTRNVAANNIEAVPNSTITATSDSQLLGEELIEKSAFEVAKNEAPTASPNENMNAFSASTEKVGMSEITRLPQLKSDLLTIDLGEIKGPEGCYNFGGRSGGPILNALSFDLLGGLGFAPRTLTNNSGDSDQDLYVDAREETESEWYAFTSTLRANMRYKSGLTFRAGLNYSQINEIFEFRNGSATQTIITTVENPDGTTTTTTEVQEGELYKLTHNRLKFFDIPLMIGFEKSVGKFTFGINAGASFNVQFSQKGDFLSELGEPVNFNSDNPSKVDYFKTKAGMSYIASAGISYQLSNNLDLHFEPHFRKFTAPVSEGAIEQSYSNFGIQAGVRYFIFDRQRK